MYQDILDAIGRGYFKKAVTNTHGFTTDDKILTGVNTSLSSQGIEFFNVFPAGAITSHTNMEISRGIQYLRFRALEEAFRVY